MAHFRPKFVGVFLLLCFSSGTNAADIVAFPGAKARDSENKAADDQAPGQIQVAEKAAQVVQFVKRAAPSNQIHLKDAEGPVFDEYEAAAKEARESEKFIRYHSEHNFKKMTQNQVSIVVWNLSEFETESFWLRSMQPNQSDKAYVDLLAAYDSVITTYRDLDVIDRMEKAGFDVKLYTSMTSPFPRTSMRR